MDLAAGWYARGGALRRRLLGEGTRVPGVTVVSVGGLRAGGVGKSVVARSVASLLAEAGIATAVVLRGYGGTETGPRRVGPGDDPAAVGDEAVEHAVRARGAWTVVVARRRVAGAALARDLGCAAVVLDDGFQHRALARDLDVVLVTAEDHHAAVWPAGPLREALTSLRHADLVATVDEASPAEIHGQRVSRCAVTLAGYAMASGALEPPSRWRGARALVVTAIARPERVVALVTAAGVCVVEHRQYRDHARLPPEALAAGGGIDVVLVTGKDAARGTLGAPAEGTPRRAVVVEAALPDVLRDAVLHTVGRASAGDAVQR